MKFYKINLDGLTQEEKRIAIFRSLINELKGRKISKVEEILSDDDLKEIKDSDDEDLMRIVLEVVFYVYLRNEFLSVREDDCGITKVFYPELLSKMKKLSEELGLKNSLELSNLYSFLLWNGYLSKDKNNIYCMDGRKLIRGLYFADIMDGVGVCLNHADMLKDFLNACGYDSSLMINYCSSNIDKAYKMNIERIVSGAKIGTKILTFVLSPLTKRVGNHAFTLIYDNGKPYIYDSTNLMALELESPYCAKLLMGEGTAQLHPYFSTTLGSNKEQIESLFKLFELEDLSSPYRRKEFILSAEENIELFKGNIELLDDFYDDARDSIESISKATDKIKARKREKRRL